MKLSTNKIGLAVGLFFAVLHALWSLFIAVIPGQVQAYLDWATGLHAIQPFITITQFNLLNAVVLVIMTFVVGYIIGFVYAWCHNMFYKK